MSEQKQFFYTPLKGKPVDEALAKEVMMLHEAGWSNVAIGKKVGRHNSNIQRLLKKLSNSETLEQKVRRLERELSEARMERDLYNEIINVAEKRFDIQIRKKAGTKQ